MSTDTIYQRLRTHLSYLGLGRTAEVLASHLEEAQRERTSATVFLERLLAEEVAATEVRRLAGRLRFAHFPVDKRLEDFDFDGQPGLDRHMIEELSTLRFVEEKANLLLIGRPGVGKTHIALGLGHRAGEAGYRVYYTTAADLAARVVDAPRSKVGGQQRCGSSQVFPQSLRQRCVRHRERRSLPCPLRRALVRWRSARSSCLWPPRMSPTESVSRSAVQVVGT
ncbi:MAG: ATP-binding protein [Actinomycetota bacterium]